MNKSFVVPVFEIQANERSLSIDLYKEIVYEAVEYDKAEKIIHGKKGLKNLEVENRTDLKALGLMLKK